MCVDSASERTKSIIFGIILIWIFWPIISPSISFLNSAVFIPINILIYILNLVGKGILFITSLFCFVLFAGNAVQGIKNNTRQMVENDTKSQIEDNESLEKNEHLSFGKETEIIAKEQSNAIEENSEDDFIE